MKKYILMLALVAMTAQGCKDDFHVPVLAPNDTPADTPPKLGNKPLPPV